jgi:hypothetical protein
VHDAALLGQNGPLPLPFGVKTGIVAKFLTSPRSHALAGGLVSDNHTAVANATARQDPVIVSSPVSFRLSCR